MRSKAACAHIGINNRPVTAKIVPKTSPVMVACSAPASRCSGYWGNREKLKKTNALIENYCEAQSRVQYIDVDAAMLDAQGKPRAGLFRWDGLHMNSKGYAIWTSIVKPVLLSRFAAVNQRP